MEIPGPGPGAEGWRFFRDALWHGKVGDKMYLPDLVEERLGVEVMGVSFSELQTDEVYLSALKLAVADNLVD